MKIQVNGEPTEIVDEITVEDLLVHLKIQPEQVAVEVDRNVVPRNTWDKTTLHEGASVEIVRFVGGG